MVLLLFVSPYYVYMVSVLILYLVLDYLHSFIICTFAPHVQLDYVIISNISQRLTTDKDSSLVVMPYCSVAVV